MEKPHPCGFLFVSIVAKFTPGVKTDCTYFAGQCRRFLHTILNTGHVYAFRYRIQPFLRQNFSTSAWGAPISSAILSTHFGNRRGIVAIFSSGFLIAYDSHTIIISFALLYFCMDNTGEFLITLMSSFAEEESRSISENVTWAVRHRYAQGIYHLPGLLLGYQRIQDGEIQVDEAGARVVRFIYLLALAGKSSTDICRILMDYEIPSPGKGHRWEPHTVRSILKNEKYMGDAILQKEITVDFLTKTRKPNEGEAPQYYVENGHPCIVSKSVWQEVQATWTDASRRNCTFSPIANKIICGDCGGRYGRKTWHSTTYRDAVWECNGKKAGRTKCKCRHIYTEELDTAIRRSMHHLLKTHQNIIPDCVDVLSQALGEISSDARSVLNDIARGKLDIRIDGLMIGILIRRMVVTPKQSLVIHFLDDSTYRHRLGATPRGTRLYNTKRDHSQILALYAEGCSAKEISQRLGISVNTVRSFLRRHF